MGAKAGIKARLGAGDNATTPRFGDPVSLQPELLARISSGQKRLFNEEGACIVVRNISAQLCSISVNKYFSWQSGLFLAARGQLSYQPMTLTQLNRPGFGNNIRKSQRVMLLNIMPHFWLLGSSGSMLRHRARKKREETRTRPVTTKRFWLGNCTA